MKIPIPGKTVFILRQGPGLVDCWITCVFFDYHWMVELSIIVNSLAYEEIEFYFKNKRFICDW